MLRFTSTSGHCVKQSGVTINRTGPEITDYFVLTTVTSRIKAWLWTPGACASTE